MHRKLVAVAAIVCCAGTLVTIDCAMAQQPAVRDWSGFHVGINAGGAWGTSNISTGVASVGNYFVTTDPGQIGAAGRGSVNSSAFTGGVQGGYTAQNGNWLLGLEADVGLLSLGASRAASAVFLSAPANAFTVSQTVGTDWIATVRPRLGWAMGDAAFYATGGLALTTLKFNAQYLDNFGTFASSQGSQQQTKVGWTIGAGVDYALDSRWSMRAEYMRVDFGQVNFNSAVTGGAAGNTAVLTNSTDFSVNIVRLGLNYRL